MDSEQTSMTKDEELEEMLKREADLSSELRNRSVLSDMPNGITMGRVNDIIPVESDYGEKDASDDTCVWLVEIVLGGEKFLCRFDLADEPSGDDFQELCDYCGVSYNTPLELIGEEVPIHIYGSSGFLLTGDEDWRIKIGKSRFGTLRKKGYNLKLRYNLLILSGILSSCGLLMHMFWNFLTFTLLVILPVFWVSFAIVPFGPQNMYELKPKELVSISGKD